MNYGLTTIRDLLTDGNIPLNGSLYLSLDQKWNLESKCLLCMTPVNDVVPEEAVLLGFERILSLANVVDIVENIRLQSSECTAEMLLSAFLFYYDHDAFIIL